MKVYVTLVVYGYPEEDGPGFIAGVYLSETKTNETKNKYRELARRDLDPLNRHPKDVDNWYNICIEELLDKLEADRVKANKERHERYCEAKNAHEELKEEFELTGRFDLNIADKLNYLNILEADACSKINCIDIAISEIKKMVH